MMRWQLSSFHGRPKSPRLLNRTYLKSLSFQPESLISSARVPERKLLWAIIFSAIHDVVCLSPKKNDYKSAHNFLFNPVQPFGEEKFWSLQWMLNVLVEYPIHYMYLIQKFTKQPNAKKLVYSLRQKRP